MQQFFSLSYVYDSENFLCMSMPKISSISGNWSQIMKLCVNLNSAILRCNVVFPIADIGEPPAVFNLAVVGHMGVL